MREIADAIFDVLRGGIARRWVVERFFAWINRNRRLAKDFEATIESVEAFLDAASTVILLPRRAR